MRIHELFLMRPGRQVVAVGGLLVALIANHGVWAAALPVRSKNRKLLKVQYYGNKRVVVFTEISADGLLRPIGN